MSKLDHARDRLKSTYLLRLFSCSEALAAARERFEHEPEESEQGMRRLAHQLRGSGGSYGFPEITEAAARLEDATREELMPRSRKLLEILLRLRSVPAERTRILVIDDDPSLFSLLALALEAPGRIFAQAKTLSEAQEMLFATPLDLIILDLILPDGDGRDLLLSIRDHEATSLAPIVVLSVKSAPNTKSECLALGVDAYLEKPVDGKLLAATVASLLERRHRFEAGSMVDPLTGIKNRAGFRRDFQQVAAITRRGGQKLSLALIDLDRFKDLNDRHGHGVGDDALGFVSRSLEETLRDSDVLARWGGEEFVVAFVNTDTIGAKTALEKVQARVRSFAPEGLEAPLGLTFSAGVVEVAPDADLDACLASADRLMYLAKAGGRAKILDSPPGEIALGPRILVVEDETVSAKLILKVLQKAGYQVDLFDSGPAALDATLGESYELVILDRNMPAMSGIEVLKDLRTRSSYARIPIVMLTSMGEDEHVEEAFALGADDYILKPFSPRQLLARLRRLLHRAGSQY